MRGLFNIVFRIVSSLLGLLVIAMGVVWILQGFGIEPQSLSRSFMVGNTKWALYGAILTLFGIGQVIWSNMRQRG